MMLGNDSYPRGLGPKAFSSLVLLLGIIVNSVIIGSIASLLQNMDLKVHKS